MRGYHQGAICLPPAIPRVRGPDPGAVCLPLVIAPTRILCSLCGNFQDHSVALQDRAHTRRFHHVELRHGASLRSADHPLSSEQKHPGSREGESHLEWKMNFQGQYSNLIRRNAMQRDQTTVQTFRLTLAASQPWFPPVRELDEEEKSSTMLYYRKLEMRTTMKNKLQTKMPNPWLDGNGLYG